MLKQVFILLLICSWSLCSAQVKLNEVCSSNRTVLVETDGSSPDWIELYNTSSEPVNLTGYYLTDDVLDTTKWEFENTLLPAFDWLVVYANDEDEADENPPQTSFRLSQDGEMLYLFSPTRQLVDSLKIPFVATDMSYGRSQDGSSTKLFFPTPTPNASNSGSVGQSQIIANTPTFSQKTRIYQGVLEVEISTSDLNTEIRYELNGSEPDSNSILYTEPLKFTEVTGVIRAKAFVDGLIPSRTATANYIHLPKQELPIVALSTHPDYFFNEDTGIYVFGPNAEPEFPYYGANFWSDTEVPVYVQWLDKYGGIGFEQTLGVRIHGGKTSRTRPMRSLRLLARYRYGKPEIDYSLFSTKFLPKNKRFVLRNSGSDYLKTMFRDGFIHNVFISNRLHLDAACFNPVEVYLNGRFWGIHNAREKIDEYYVHYNYGYDVDDVDMLEEEDQIVSGSWDEFDQHEAMVLNSDMTSEEDFTAADSVFDLLNMADYYICQTYINNTDWPYNNLKLWKARVDSSKWRYIIFDLDATLGGVGFVPADLDSYARTFGSYGDTNRHIILFRKLLENPDFFKYYINRYCDLRNTVLSEDEFVADVERAASNIENVIPRHFERWSPEDNDWYEQVEIIKDYIRERPTYAINYLQDFYQLGNQANIGLNVYPPSAGQIDLNSVSVHDFPFRGVYFDDILIEVSIRANTGFKFSHWESNREEFHNSTELSHSFNATEGDQLTAVFIGNSEYEDINVYPNPALETTTLEFVNEKQQQVEVFLSDLSGNKTHLLYSAIMLAGTHRLSLPLPSGISGVYLLTVQSATRQVSEKLVILKP